MSWIDDFRDEFSSVVQGVWPDVVLPSDNPAGRNFYTTMQTFGENLLEKAVAALAEIQEDLVPPPYFILQFGRDVHAPEYGIANNYRRMPVVVWKIDARANDATQMTLHSDGIALQEAIDAATMRFETFRSMGPNAMVDSSESNPINQVLRAKGKIHLLAVGVTWSPGIITGTA